MSSQVGEGVDQIHPCIIASRKSAPGIAQMMLIFGVGLFCDYNTSLEVTLFEVLSITRVVTCLLKNY